jgi:hypothetical protein
MILLVAQVCVGCGQILDELELSDGRPSWIAAAVYSEKYEWRRHDNAASCVDGQGRLI